MKANTIRIAEIASKYPRQFSRQQISLWRYGHGAQLETLCRLATLEEMTPEEAGRQFFLPENRNVAVRQDSPLNPPDSPSNARTETESKDAPGPESVPQAGKEMAL